MLRIVAALGFVVLSVATCSLKFSANRQIAKHYVEMVESIKAYYDTGGEEADRNIRHVVGFCGEELAGGKLPYGFKQVMADAFIFVLSNMDDKSLKPENYFEVYLNRRAERVESLTQGLEESSAEEKKFMTKAGSIAKKEPTKLGTCIYEQIKGRGWLPASDA